MPSEYLFQFILEASQVKQGSARQRIDEDVTVLTVASSRLYYRRYLRCSILKLYNFLETGIKDELKH